MTESTYSWVSHPLEAVHIVVVELRKRLRIASCSPEPDGVGKTLLAHAWAGDRHDSPSSARPGR
jgi:hypothetical protein